MASITLQGNPLDTIGDLPATGQAAPAFSLTATDLSAVNLSDYDGQAVILNIYPSVDTGVCAASTREFNERAGAQGTPVLCISADLPFAHGRFCEAEGLQHVKNLSVFRAPEFGQQYGVTITNGPLEGLLSRAVVVVKNGQVVYTEQVPEITQEPDYQAALDAAA